MASVSISKRMTGKSSSGVRFRISLWRNCFAARALKSGGRTMPEPLIGVLMSVARSPRNDGFGIFARYGRSDLDGFRPDQRPGAGRSAPGPCGFSRRLYRELRPGDRLPDYVARAAVPDQRRSTFELADRRRNLDQPH